MKPLPQGWHEKIVSILVPVGAKKIAIFGSYARENNHPDSDLDILIWYDKVPDGWGFIGAKLQLEDELGVKVDLVTDRGLSPYLRESILNSAQTIYAE